MLNIRQHIKFALLLSSLVALQTTRSGKLQRRLLEAVWIIHLETLQVSIHGNSPIFSKFLGLRALSCLAHELFLPKVKEWALREPQWEGRENLLWTALGEDARTDARTAVYPVCCYSALVAEPCRTKRSWLA